MKPHTRPALREQLRLVAAPGLSLSLAGLAATRAPGQSSRVSG